MDNRRPSETPRRFSDTPRRPSETPRRPSETPRRPSETPRRPSETPRRPSETPRRPSETPMLRRISESPTRRQSSTGAFRGSRDLSATRRSSKGTSFDDRGGKPFYVPQEYLDHVDISRGRLPSTFPETDYDPYEHRAPTHAIKTWMAYLDIMRSLVVPGLLIMPLAISQAGMLLGPILTLSIAGILIHTHSLLLSSLNEVCRQIQRPYISYRFGFRLAVLHGPPLFHWLGEQGPCIVALFTIMSQLGICTVFIIIIVDSMRDIFDLPPASTSSCLTIMLIPFLVLALFMRTLSIVSYVSSLGNFFNSLGLISMIITCFNKPAARLVRLVTPDIWRVFWAVGAIFFNMSVVAVLLSVDKAVAKPSIMRSRYGVVNLGIMIPTLITMTFGCLAYWAHGQVEQNILRDLPLDEDLTNYCIAFYILTLTFSYPIQCHPAIGTIVEVIKHHDPNSIVSDENLEIVKGYARPAFVCTTFLIAYLLPHQGPFVAFVGNLCTSMLALTFPAIMDLCLRYPNRYGKYLFHLVKDLAIITFGVAVWVLGGYFCGYIIYLRILSSLSPSIQEYY